VTFSLLVSTSSSRRPLPVTVRADDEFAAAFSFWRGSACPLVRRVDARRLIVSDGHTTIRVQLLSCAQ
jgi:hypothetical protein